MPQAVARVTHPAAVSGCLPVGPVFGRSAARQGFASPLRGLDRLPHGLQPRLWGGRPFRLGLWLGLGRVVLLLQVKSGPLRAPPSPASGGPATWVAKGTFSASEGAR